MTWALDKAIKTGTRLSMVITDPPTGRSKELPPLLQNAGEPDNAFIIRARGVLNSNLTNLNGQLAAEQDVTAQIRGGVQESK